MEDEVRAIYKRGKSQETDFKSESTTPARLAQSLVALANSTGGTVLLGVGSRSAKLMGLKDPEAARDKALKAALLADPPLIIPLPELVNLDGAEILVITVPPGLPHVYSLKGRYLMRDGPRDAPMTPRQVRQLMMERGEVSFEPLATPGATLKDMDWEKVERYLVPLESVPGQTAEEALYKRGCLTRKDDRYRPTNAGLLLFGREPERFFRSSEIIVVRYAGREMSDEFLREDIRDTLPEQIRRAESFVVSNMSKGVRLVRLEREERTEYPVEAVREAIVNAVAHRDYGIRGEGIRILMFSDRMEFYSPGRLPGHVTLDNIIEERFSRNEVIVQVLADMGFIERLGYGIDRMIQLMLDHGLPAPVFQETANGFQVTLHGHGEALISDEVDARRWRHLHLNERQEKALAYLAERGRITNREYQELCPDVSAETIRRDLANLVDRNLLLKIGDKRATYYIFK